MKTIDTRAIVVNMLCRALLRSRTAPGKQEKECGQAGCGMAEERAGQVQAVGLVGKSRKNEVLPLVGRAFGPVDDTMEW